MNDLKFVFEAIKEYCKEAVVPDEKCFSELEKLVTGWQLFLPLYVYLEVLQSIGLIIFYRHNNVIQLTGKGKATGFHSLPGLRACALLFLYSLRWVFLFILFWPVFLTVPKPNNSAEKNSAG